LKTFSFNPGGLFLIADNKRFRFAHRVKAIFLNRIIAALWLSLWAVSAWGATLVVEDSTGRNVEITLPLQKIVALNSDILEVLRTLKVENLVVGVYSEIVRDRQFWQGLVDKPKVGGWQNPNIEAIVKLQPNIVITYTNNPGPFLEQKLAGFGIQVLRLDLYKSNNLEREVQVLGKLLERANEAARFCEWHSRHLDLIRGKIAATQKRPATYLETYSDYHAAGPDSGGEQMCVLSGGYNIASRLAISSPQVTPEWVVAQNPEVIVKAASYGNGYATADPAPFNQRRDAILGRPCWHHITAVASRQVHVMDSSIWTGPRDIIGIAYMARWFHPDLFADLDPAALHKEYLETFQGLPYRGVFVSDDSRGVRK
jgi:iron complex transport system substrate-binding protein